MPYNKPWLPIADQLTKLQARGMQVEDAAKAADYLERIGYGVTDGRVFASWLRSLNYLRNVCAHHSRLWNRNVVEEPKLPAAGVVSALDGFICDSRLRTRPFLLLCICQHLMGVINPLSTWGDRLKQQLQTGFPDLCHVGVTLQGMGVDEGWERRVW